MGKRKRSRSKDSDYNDILRKTKKLERKLKERRERSLSVSPNSSSLNYRDENYDRYYDVYPDEDAYDPAINLDDGIDDEECPAQIDSPPPPPPAPATKPPAPPSLPPIEAVPGTSSSVILPEGQDADATVNLDPVILDLLGEDPSTKKSFGASLHKGIAPRWAHILTNGLDKESQTDLIKQYRLPENCTNLSSPKLNPEMKAALSDLNIKQDQYSQGKQNQLGSGLAALGQALNWAVTAKDIVPPDIVKALINAVRLICDNHYRESLSRRYAVMDTLNKNIRDTVKDTKIDENIFGSNLSDHLKSSKAITKTGSEMKPAPRTPYTYRAPPARHQLSSQSFKLEGELACSSGRAADSPRASPAAAYPAAARSPPDSHAGSSSRFRILETSEETLNEPQNLPSTSRGPCSGGSQVIRDSLITRGVPLDSLDIVMASFSPQTLKQYSSSITSWASYCINNNLNILNVDSYNVISFLTQKFNEGASYSSLNTHRSALSIILGTEVTLNDCIKRFMKGVYRLNPPRPKYISTWDTNIVLNYLSNTYDDISLPNLTYKTSTLLCIASAQRMQTISLIKLQNITIQDDVIIIRITDLIKTSRPGACQPLIRLPFIRENPSICPALALKTYIEKTQHLRQNSPDGHLFLGICKPHKKVGTQTLARWVKKMLHESGIDISIFGAHSTRSASTSAAHSSGVNLEVVRKAAGCSDTSNVFLKYYYRDVEKTNQDDFFNAILN